MASWAKRGIWLSRAILDTSHKKTFCDPTWLVHEQVGPGDDLSFRAHPLAGYDALASDGMLPMPVEDWLPAAVRAAAIDRKLKPGEPLFRLGDNTAGFCEIITGRVRLARVDRSGREIVLHDAGPGETLAEASLFSAKYHCDAIASTNATVRVYPKREVLAAFEESPKAAKAFSATLAHQVMNLRTRLEQRNIRSARGRLQHFLALNTGPDGRTVALRGTLKDLAAELGLTHEALYRTLGNLERSREIKRNGAKITLSKRI
jgi:CRP-like cAMP-binding protein